MATHSVPSVKWASRPVPDYCDSIPGAQTSMIQCLQYFEHLAEPIAEILTLLKDQFDHTQLAEGILRCVERHIFQDFVLMLQ